MYSALELDGSVRVCEFGPSSAIRRADAWHWHWPEGQFNTSKKAWAYLKLFYLRFMMWVASLRHIPIVWTAHNARSHGGLYPEVEALFWRDFTSKVSGVHYLGNASRETVISAHPGLESVRSITTMHGEYPHPARPSRAEARCQLRLPQDKTVLAFVGRVSEYKGVIELIETFRAADLVDTHLLVAGDPDSYMRSWLAQHTPSTRETYLLTQLDDWTYECALACANLLILPYRRITNSGSVLHAISARRPVLVPDLPPMREIQDHVGDWVLTYQALSPKSLGEAIVKIEAMSPSASPDMSAFRWSEIASAVRALLSEAKGGRDD
jgi:glycosyltransferase involved in cell wall biosynthesis